MDQDIEVMELRIRSHLRSESGVPAIPGEAGQRWGLAGLPDRNAEQDSSAVAFIEGDRRLTSAEFLERCKSVAGLLRDLGIGPGQRVATLIDNRLEFVELMFAIMRLGAVLVPLNWRNSAEEIVQVLQDSGAEVLIVGPSFGPKVEHVRTSVPSLREVVYVDRLGPVERHYESLVETANQAETIPSMTPDDVFAILYTGGTTGRPKGVILTHRSILISAEHQAKFFELGPRDVVLNVVPLFHVGMCNLLAAALVGGTNVLMRTSDARGILSAIARYRVTWVGLIHTLISDILGAPDLASIDTSSLRCLAYGGASMPAALLDRAIDTFGPVLYQQYGLTESAGMVAGLAAAEHAPECGERRFSVGRALPGYTVECWDDLGTAVSTGETGEIAVKAPTVMVGYWHQPELTAQALKDGFLRTGDIGRLDAQGYLWIVDRKKEMIISGGENIFPKEVEGVLSRHPAIAEVAVVGLPHPRWGEAVTAYVVPRKNADISSGDVVEYCRAHLASYKKPQQVIFIDALPRTGVGKIDKPALRRLAHGDT